MCRSVPHTPTAATSSSTSPPPGAAGAGTSASESPADALVFCSASIGFLTRGKRARTSPQVGEQRRPWLPPDQQIFRNPRFRRRKRFVPLDLAGYERRHGNAIAVQHAVAG